MTRVLGGCVLLALGAYGAFFTGSKEKKRLSVLDAWIELLYRVRNQIDCFSLPLPQILKTTDRVLLEKLGQENECVDTKSLMDASFPFLDNDSQKILEDWAREIGTTYREEQVKRSDHYLRALEAHRNSLKERLPMRIKMLTTLHLCASLGAVILLW